MRWGRAAERQDAIRILGLAPERVAAIYPGVTDSFFSVPAEAVRSVRERHGLRRDYALFVGTIEPRKNVGALLDAYAALSEAARGEFDLVVAGPAGWQDQATLDRLQSGARGVRYLGYVPEADLPGLTAGATVFLYPSLYEGFGFPLAQAMAAGVPAITSNVSSMPEIAAGAALLVEPRSCDGIRAAMERLLSSAELRATLSRAGRKQAERYRWEVCARESLEFFRRVAG